MEGSCEMLSSRHDMASTPVNSLRLWLPAQDPPETKQTKFQNGCRDDLQAPLLTEEVLKTNSGWKAGSFYFEEVATVRFPMLQRMYGQHQLDSVGYIKIKT